MIVDKENKVVDNKYGEVIYAVKYIYSVRYTGKYCLRYTLPRKEKKRKETLENKGMITYLPTIYVKRRWKEQVKEIQIPAVNRCVFIYATGTELEGLKGIYPTLPIEMTEVGH